VDNWAWFVRVSLAADPQQAYWTLKKVLTFYSLPSGYSDMLAKMGWGEVVSRVQVAHRTEGFTAARRLIPNRMVADVPMYAAAGSARCVVGYVAVGEDLRGELRAFLDSAASLLRVGQGSS
jgi:hypothetical protein